MAAGLLSRHQVEVCYGPPLRPADTTMLLDTKWSVCTVYMLLHLHKLHETHKADIALIAFAIWCMHFMMLASSIVCA